MTFDELLKLSDQMFTKRGSLLTHWQDVADSFYPQRADFTSSRSLGEEFASHLVTSYPILAHRELSGTLSSMLRPKDRDWFYLETARPEQQTHDANIWLEWAAGSLRRAMYDRAANFTRATKEADGDFVAFGQAVISVELAPSRLNFLYRTWHLRDCAWSEGLDGKVDHFCRKWRTTASELLEKFPKTAGKEARDAVRLNEPFKEFECRHMVIPSRGMYRQPWRSVFMDVDNKNILEDVGSWGRIYVVPRWQTVSGSQYAFSPAVVAALPDARLLQAITLTLLDAGEMYAAPPYLAVQEAIRGDIDLRSRGITWVDANYDERMGDALRPLTQDARGFPIADTMREEAQRMIAEAFYLNKLNLPAPTSAEMTAFEVSQRIQEFIRTTLPLFEPIEDDYNGAVCEETFALGIRNGMFGPASSIPQELQNQDVQFKFVSPITAARDQEKGGRFVEAKNLLLEGAQLDPSALLMMDVRKAMRDALKGINTPTRWLHNDDYVEALFKQQQEEQAQLQQMAGAEQLAGAANQAGGAMKQFAEAGAVQNAS